MAVGKVFMSGNSQAVRLPKEFRLATDEVEITRQDNGLFIRPRSNGLAEAYHLICQLPADMFEGIKDERSPEERPDL